MNACVLNVISMKFCSFLSKLFFQKLHQNKICFETQLKTFKSKALQFICEWLNYVITFDKIQTYKHKYWIRKWIWNT